MKFVLLHERKLSGDQRVLFSPSQLALIIEQYPQHQFVVESSPTRCFSDQEYRDKGIAVTLNIHHCEVFLGIKEVPAKFLISGKTYFFFSHTSKMQPHNKTYLQELKKANISFYDYENFTDNTNNRLVAFGKSAGEIGAYHAIRTYGLKHQLFNLPNPYQCDSIEELLFFASNTLLKPLKIVVTGNGNVGKGVSSFFDAIGIKKVNPSNFLKNTYNSPVYTQLSKKHYLTHQKHGTFDLKNFIENPNHYKSTFLKYAQQANIFVAGHYYHKGMPLFFSPEEMQHPSFKISTIADISCDVSAPLPTCLRVSTPQSPIYGYDKFTGKETNYLNPNSIAVMGVDNLPCELPSTSSIDFGEQFIKNILPYLTKSLDHPTLQKACILKDGSFTKPYKYLEDFLASNEYQLVE